jgi:hypothetical protein
MTVVWDVTTCRVLDMYLFTELHDIGICVLRELFIFD